MCFIIMGTKLQKQDQPDGSRNAHFQLCRPHSAVSLHMPAHARCTQTLSCSHELLNKKASRAAPKEQFVPRPLTTAFHLQQVGLSTAPSIQDGEGIVRCGTSINISKRNRWHEKRWTWDLFRLETKKLQGSFILDGLAFWFISISIPNLYT